MTALSTTVGEVAVEYDPFVGTILAVKLIKFCWDGFHVEQTTVYGDAFRFLQPGIALPFA